MPAVEPVGEVDLALAFVTTDGASVTDARTLAAQIGLAKAMRRYDLRRVVSFHSRVAWAQDFSRSLPGVIKWMPSRQRPRGTLWSSYVSGEMPSGHRDSLLSRLRELNDGERGLLCNARCLAEGVDVPTLDAVAFIDPRRSEVDVVQAVGRAIRKSPEKKMGTIVLPVFIGRGDDPEAELEASAFQPVWEVLKALRAHDEDLAEELDELRRGLGYRHTLGHRPGKLQLLLPVGLHPSFARAFDAVLVEQTTARWNYWYGLLQGYVEREGGSSVPFDHSEDENRLGYWLRNQRARRSGLTSNQRKLLEALPKWQWDVQRDEWERRFAAFARYSETHGHASPRVNEAWEGDRIGTWVNSQRTRYKEGLLETDRADRLAAIPGWTWDSRDAQWDRAFQLLMRYVEREGHAKVPPDHVEDGLSLGRWVILQRSAKGRARLKKSRPERYERLEGLRGQGWSWDAWVDRWERAFSALEGYAAREGHAQVPFGHVEGDIQLGSWVGNQRQFHRRAGLGRERTQRLESLPGWTWDARGDRARRAKEGA